MNKFINYHKSAPSIERCFFTQDCHNVYHNSLFNFKYNLLILLLISIISYGQCGLVAYSTELERKDKSHYTYKLETFQDIWIHMFLWAFLSIFLVHALASAIALATLRKHKYGRYISVLILLYGIICALAVSCVTSLIIAFVLVQAKIEVLLIHAMLCGFCQLGIFLFVTFYPETYLVKILLHCCTSEQKSFSSKISF